MKKDAHATLDVQGALISVRAEPAGDFVSLTDMCQNFEGGSALIEQWIRNKDTLGFLATWEKLNNPSFNSPEFEGIRGQAGSNTFYMSVKKWIEATSAIGIVARTGRYGGTFAHQDIAFEFGSWLSPEFKLYLIKEFQRMKLEENSRLSLEWNLNRTLSKLNYRIHTDAIKEHIVPHAITPDQATYAYANEADLLNVAIFGKTARQWRDANPNADGNMRENASVEQLLVLANIESLNAEFIKMGLSPETRLKRLNQIAIEQMESLAKSPTRLTPALPLGERDTL